jgi:hypothetical protein
MRLPWTIIAIGLALALTACEPEKQYVPMQKEHNRTGQPMTVTVYEYSSYRDVTTALQKFHGRRNKVDNSLGWAAWDLQAPYQCEIHIKPPDKIDDDDVLTLGHEMAHCLYGSYHP